MVWQGRNGARFKITSRLLTRRDHFYHFLRCSLRSTRASKFTLRAFLTLKELINKTTNGLTKYCLPTIYHLLSTVTFPTLASDATWIAVHWLADLQNRVVAVSCCKLLQAIAAYRISTDAAELKSPSSVASVDCSPCQALARYQLSL